MARWKRAALPGRAITANSLLYSKGQRLRDQVGTDQIKAKVGEFVRVRSRLGLHCISPDQVQRDRRTALHPRITEILARLEVLSQGVGVLQSFAQLIVGRVRRGGSTSTDAENDPR